MQPGVLILGNGMKLRENVSLIPYGIPIGGKIAVLFSLVGEDPQKFLAVRMTTELPEELVSQELLGKIKAELSMPESVAHAWELSSQLIDLLITRLILGYMDDDLVMSAVIAGQNFIGKTNGNWNVFIELD